MLDDVSFLRARSYASNSHHPFSVAEYLLLWLWIIQSPSDPQLCFALYEYFTTIGWSEFFFNIHSMSTSEYIFFIHTASYWSQDTIYTE